MSEYQCSEAQFLADIPKHQMTAIRDDGVNRHIRFGPPGTGCCRFDLVTWPGILVITGDCGTYVFSRITDMFDFFRVKPNDWNYNREGGLSINPGYWSEKLLACDSSGRRGGSATEFSAELFRKRVIEWVDEYEFDNEEAKADCLSEVESEVIAQAEDGDESHAMHAAMSFRHESGFEFTDFYEVNCQIYTWHFIWCLYAITWGIKTYDAKSMTTSLLSAIGHEVAA